MKTEVRHDERWHVTVHVEDGAGWPSSIPVNALSARHLKPETVTFVVVDGQEHPEGIEVFGPYLDGPNAGRITRSRFSHERVPGWLATVIEDVRQYHHLNPHDVVDERTAKLRGLVRKWISHARHPSRSVGEYGAGSAEALQQCAQDLHEVLR